MISAAFFATEIYVPYLLQEHYGLPLWLSGASLTVGALGWAGASQVQARLGARLANAPRSGPARCCSSPASAWCSARPRSS